MTDNGLLPRPIFIVSPPRSGSSLLFVTLRQSAGTFSIGGESHQLIEGIPALHPRTCGWSSNRLTARDATPDIIATLRTKFRQRLRDRDGRPPQGPAVMIEKTPKNSLRLPFLLAVFPDARFVFLQRDARETVSSMIEAWASRKFRTYPGLPGRTDWSLLLVPGWEAMAGMDAAETAARQWTITARTLLDDLETVPDDRAFSISYDSFLAAPENAMRALAAALDLEWDRTLPAILPLSPSTVSLPSRDKWKRHEAALAPHVAMLGEQEARAKAFLAATGVIR